MDLQAAGNNWNNFFRSMVGLPTQYPVKIVRDEAAKRFPLIGIKKDGDVGYDVPATGRVVIPAMTEDARDKFSRRMSIANAQSNPEFRKTMIDSAWAALPKAVIPTGISIQMPNNIWATIEARSSSSSVMLITPDSVIDAGYRGPLFAVVFNLGARNFIVEPGDRLVQVIFHNRILAKLEEVNELDSSERGATGFGSTGTGEMAQD